MQKPVEVFFIAPDVPLNDPRLALAMFDGPGWYWWGGRCGEGDVEGPYETREKAERAANA